MALNETWKRVVEGNKKIQEAYHKALLVDVDRDRDKWDNQWEVIDRACEKLNGLTSQLKAEGWNKCLFSRPTCSMKENRSCWACPSDNDEWRGT